MAKYLALIRRTDFTDLFKYGSLYLNHLTIVEYDDDSDILDGGKTIIKKLFRNANLFESSFTYLIIEFVKANFFRDLPVVDMEDVVRVYPLDREAKKEFETSFDEHIRIESPRWEQAFSTIQRIRTKKDCEKGAKNVSRLYGIQEDAKGFREIITDDILEELVSELYRNIRPTGNLPIRVYMLRYERHAFYPEETVGFFMDAVHVVCNYLQQGEVDETDVSRTLVMRFLESPSCRMAKMDAILHKKKAIPTSIDTDNYIDTNEYETIIDDLKKRIKSLEQENERLKKELEKFKSNTPDEEEIDKATVFIKFIRTIIIFILFFFK